MAFRPPYRAYTAQEDAVRAIRLAREISAGFRDYRIRPEGLSPTLLIATLRRLESGEVFDSRDDITFECITEYLDDLLQREVAGSRIVPVTAGYDDDGQECVRMCSVPAYTSRGEEIAQLQVCLWSFLELREHIKDVVAAEVAIAALARR